MKLLRRSFIIFTLVSLCFVYTPSAQAEAGREFLLSCTYGVLAGALVGAASLAVEDDPSSKIHRVARGASLGLYTGILLGLYVVYVVPAQLEQEQQEQLDEQYEQVIDPEDYGFRYKYRPTTIQYKVARSFKPPRVTILPVFENNQVTGAALNYNVMSF